MEQIKGKYLLDRRLGCGGMAEVFLGRTLGAGGFSRRVAIKRILPGYSRDPQFRRMFTEEARLSSYLAHSNIVSVLDFDEDEAGCLFLVMEYVDGIDLNGLMRTSRLPPPVVLSITGEILRGLEHAHELPTTDGGPCGLVHRDVSPQNVLLAWDGSVRISDFGIAKARAAAQASASLFIKGKPAYMSPEQVQGTSLDGRSDLFAVGVILWEMLCGEALFHHDDSVEATLAAVLFGVAPSPRARRPDVPEDVERVTMRLLEKPREARYANATAAIAALEACAAYPKSGREALAALLAARLPDRAPRRAERRPADPEASPCPKRPPELADPYGSATARRGARSRGARRVLLVAAGAVAAVGVALHLTGDRGADTGPGAPSTSPHASPFVPAPAEAPAAHRSAGAGSAPASGASARGVAPEPAGRTATARVEQPEAARRSRAPIPRAGERPREPKARAAAPPIQSGFREIDLRAAPGD